MTTSMVTFIAPLGLDKLTAAQTSIDQLGNPATADVRRALALKAAEQEGTHFVSLHAVASPDGTRAYLVIEFSADGDEKAATARFVAALKTELRPIAMLSSDWTDGGDLAAFLDAHKVPIGNGLFGNPGLCFAGTLGFSVGKILFEDRIAQACATALEKQPGGTTALARIADVRRTVEADPSLATALEPATAAPPFTPDLATTVKTGVGQFATMYLWPLLLILLLAGLASGVVAAWAANGIWPAIVAFVMGAVRMVWQAAWLAVVVILGGGVFLYAALRRAEATDSLEAQSVPRAMNRAMFAHENRLAQNHMISITRRKPGWLRWFTSRLVFWVIGLAATTYFRPGFLSDIGSIHFARWVTVPGTRDLMFLSNYDGSWESYLEDFITKAHAGLTGVWSNTVGFPRTENLFLLGATDGDRFKRFARHSMVPTRFWYSAYPTLTTTRIRSNAVIRAGLSGVMTEDEAIDWLALFGSAARPPSKLVSSDIQSLIFGGLKFLPFGTCMIVTLPEARAAAQAWLEAIRRDIAFNDGRRLVQDAVYTLALSWRGLQRLGLPDDAKATFPFAFVEGMTQTERSRVLGDTGPSAPDRWRWGREPPDAAILIYGRSAEAVAGLRTQFLASCESAGMGRPFEVPLETVTENKAEPFGFTDGISQPVIRGTYKSLRKADPIHLVEPGEMVLGYPDNRNYIPPSPTLPPNADPGNKLPLLGAPNDLSRAVVDTTRDVGFNGSFLVIRELEQEVEAFAAYCHDAAADLTDRLAPPYAVTAEFIGAKLIGRWKDGSSVLRHPYEPATAQRTTLLTRAAAAHQAGDGALATQSPEVDATSRPKSHPKDGTPIDPIATHPESGAAPGPEHAGGHHNAKPIRPDNDFLFGAEDPQGMRCPYGAHIRRSNPRDSLDPGNAEQVAISNRHRITRVGRRYAPVAGQKPGLFFMCFCADIERQFEFLQQTWLNSPSFHGLDSEKDPLLGDAQQGGRGFTIPSPDGPIGLPALPHFVTTRGGGYFFIPGRRLVDYLIDPL